MFYLHMGTTLSLEGPEVWASSTKADLYLISNTYTSSIMYIPVNKLLSN
jgi:hypothetical protein